MDHAVNNVLRFILNDLVTSDVIGYSQVEGNIAKSLFKYIGFIAV